MNLIKNRNRFKTFFSFLGVLVFTFLVLEVGVRILVTLKPVYDVEMWRYATDLKQNSKYPEMAHEHIPNENAKLYGVDVAINSKGLRDREFEYERTRKVQRILALGDSLTFGWGVSVEKTFPKLLETSLPGSVEVINAGVGNYNSVQEAAYYKHEGYKYHPDRVLLLYFINDAEPTPGQLHEPSLFENSMLYVFGWSRLRRLLVLVNQTPDFVHYYRNLYQQEGWGRAQTALKELRQESLKNGAELTVAVCPELRVLKPEYPFQKEHDAILGFLTKEKIDHVDLLPGFQASVKKESEFWVSAEDSHPNELGHKLMASLIAQHWPGGMQ